MRRRLPELLLAAACALPFYRLGLGEIQPWDESLYAIRAKACLMFGAWLDQSQYAVGHLYSATHPPLGVWLIAISNDLFGNSTFAIRLPIACAASACVFLLWLIVRKFATKESALIAAISLSVADVFLEFSHFAQMECPMLFFGLATIYALIIAIERERWMLSLLAGMLLGSGLLTKFSEVFFIIPFLLLLPWVLDKPRAIRYVGVAIAVSIAVVVPWFVMMASRHPDYWSHVHGSLETLREGHYAPSRLAWWYYLNRLFVGLPLILSVLFVGGGNRLFRASVAWLVTLLLVLQLVGTRMPHFAFLMLAPGALLIGSSWNRLLAVSSKRKVIVVIALLLAVGWSGSEQIRLFVTHRIVWNDIIFKPAGLITMLIALVLSVNAFRIMEDRLRLATAFSILLLGIGVSHLCSEGNSVFENGASQVATIIAQPNMKTNLVLIHSGFPNEQFAPQLAYYTNGWTLGWIPGKTSHAITWDSVVTNSYIPDSTNEIAVVIRFEDRFNSRSASESMLWNTLLSKLRKDFSHERDYYSYFMFY